MQKDLFDSQKSNLPPITDTEKANFLQSTKITLALDQILFIFIGLLVTVVIVYTMGVERGKRFERTKVSRSYSGVMQAPVAVSLSREPLISPMSVDLSLASSASTPVQSATAVKKAFPHSEASSMIPAKLADLSAKPNGKYTLQIIAYKQKSIAEALNQKLQKQGLHSFVYQAGQYYNVCADGFESRQQAAAYLKDLKTNKIAPSDAYVRNMPHI